MYEEMGLADQSLHENMTEWPDFFTVNNLPPVRKTELKPKPRLNNFKSMENLLQEYNIRD